MLAISEFKERRNNMSFNYAYMNSDFIVMGSDSRETFENGTYNDNRQKTFWNEKLKLCWSFTGLTKMNNIDNIAIINIIMNSSSDVVHKLELIQCIMCYQTLDYYKIYHKNAIFDMFVGVHDNFGLHLYCLEIKNGEPNLEQNKMYSQLNLSQDISIASGVHTELWREVSFVEMKSNPIKTVQNLINKAIKVSQKTDKTVGGKAQVVLMDNSGKLIISNEE